VFCPADPLHPPPYPHLKNLDSFDVLLCDLVIDNTSIASLLNALSNNYRYKINYSQIHWGIPGVIRWTIIDIRRRSAKSIRLLFNSVSVMWALLSIGQKMFLLMHIHVFRLYSLTMCLIVIMWTFPIK